MLSNKAAYATLVATDIKRARKFYEDKLGLMVAMEDPSPGFMVMAGEGTMFYVYQRGPSNCDHTVLEFKVDDVEAEVMQLKEKGVKFEDYDIPSMGIKTVNGIATMGFAMGQEKAAWFKDTEGNILALGQMSKTVMDKVREKKMAGMSA